MEAITHIIMGIFIQNLCFKYMVFPYNIIFTIIFAFFSHFIVDAFAKITYHTPEPHKEDKFWVVWHIITYALALVVAVWMMIIGMFLFYLLGAIFANFVDIWDWLILRPTQRKKQKENPESNWGEKFFIHPLIDKFRDKTLFWLPNWNYERKGIIPEIITLISLWILTVLFQI